MEKIKIFLYIDKNPLSLLRRNFFNVILLQNRIVKKLPLGKGELSKHLCDFVSKHCHWGGGNMTDAEAAEPSRLTNFLLFQ